MMMGKRAFRRNGWQLGWILVLFLAQFVGANAWALPYNVLFIAVDDLRPALGCYGDPIAETPSMDRLARRGTLFSRAYCQQAVCSPSRLSVLTGLRPDTIRVWDLNTHFRVARPNAVTLPELFKNHGYTTQSIGKIFHGSGQPSKDPQSWTKKAQYDYVRDPVLRYALPENLAGSGLKRGAYEAGPVSDDYYTDGKVAEAAVEAMMELRLKGKPFFLAVGFRKPHLPFCAPKRYWDLYDRNWIPALENSERPEGAPELAYRSWRELEGYTDIGDKGPESEAKVQALRHGYYACVSYVDRQIGRLLDRLDGLELTNETVVCLWGDHGFHLGEQGIWAKANNFEWSTRVPLIVSVPGQKSVGATSHSLVELVDLYPTIAAACSLPLPKELEGISLLPLLENPNRRWKNAAFSQYPRARGSHRHKGRGDIMGYTIRTDRYRYVEWQDLNSDAVLARELYDHTEDPGEMINLALSPDRSSVLAAMQRQLQDGWQRALPTKP